MINDVPVSSTAPQPSAHAMGIRWPFDTRCTFFKDNPQVIFLGENAGATFLNRRIADPEVIRFFDIVNVKTSFSQFMYQTKFRKA